MKNVRVKDLLALIPDRLLEKIAKDLNVDRSFQKLTGLKMFKVLLYSLAETTRISLRTMECVYNHLFNKNFLGGYGERTRHSSLSDRLAKIKPDYFESIFKFLVEKYQSNFESKKYKNIYRFDSTMIGFSAKLLHKIGLNCGAHKLSHFKVTIGQKGLIPTYVRFCSEKEDVCEEAALKKAILDASIKQNDITVFDRGLNGGRNLIELDKAKIAFVTRTDINRKHKIIEDLSSSSLFITPTMEVLSDQKIQLQRKSPNYFFKVPFRLIKIRSLKTDENFWFLTNILTLEAYEIAEIYQRRWDIEVFFKFVKQELNLKHFLVRNLNGMKVYVYMILIFAVLLLIYKTRNNLSGYKFVKRQFFRELEIEITADIVEKYGGDKNRYLKDWDLA